MISDTGSIGFCFDFDGTLVSTPVLPMVASAVDLVEEIEVLGRATDAGELPFARSMRLRCRILDGVPVSEARRRVAVASFDSEVAAVLRAKADRSHVLTALPDCWIPDLAEQLGCAVYASTARVEGDRLVEVSEVIDKAAVVAGLREQYSTIVAIGSDAGDLAMLEAADVRVAFGAAPPGPVRDVADYWVTSGRALWALLRPL